MNITHLKISWGISKGRDTNGYNICRLDDSKTHKRYKCMGGGYDMVGTVFGRWLEDVYQEDLKAIPGVRVDCGYAVPGYTRINGLYGLTFKPNGMAKLDGACGVTSMISKAEAIGLTVQWESNKKGQTIGFFI